MSPLGERVPGTRHPSPVGTAIIRLGARTGKMCREELGTGEGAATPPPGSGLDDKKAKV